MSTQVCKLLRALPVLLCTAIMCAAMLFVGRVAFSAYESVSGSFDYVLPSFGLVMTLIVFSASILTGVAGALLSLSFGLRTAACLLGLDTYILVVGAGDTTVLFSGIVYTDALGWHYSDGSCPWIVIAFSMPSLITGLLAAEGVGLGERTRLSLAVAKVLLLACVAGSLWFTTYLPVLRKEVADLRGLWNAGDASQMTHASRLGQMETRPK